MSIKAAFNAGAKDYDSARKQLIPCFDEFYGIPLTLIPFDNNEAINILDLGAGTGLFSSLVSHYYPKATFTLYDLSDAMLAEAKGRFENSELSVNYCVKDYSSESIEGKYDVIISALSIHHLTDLEKAALFKKIYASLNNNGVFINADQVLGETENIEKTYRETWLKQVRERGVSEASLAASLERMKEDKMSTLSKQLDWLKQAQFSDVNCWYKNVSFVVYSGKKSRLGEG